MIYPTTLPTRPLGDTCCIRSRRNRLARSSREERHGRVSRAALREIGRFQNPPLTAAERERAELLSYILRDVGITHIHTTDFKRVRNTAEPISDRLGIEPRLYSEVEDLADGLRDATGNHLVIGCTNTTFQLVRLLGGVSTNIPLHENDRLYIVTLNPDGTASNVPFRYGSP